MKKKNKTGGEVKFDKFYFDLYAERWPRLKEALLKESEEKVSPEGLKEPYYMDTSSLLTASLLPVTPSSTVLDMCAAPGGKSLVLALNMEGKGLLVSNDRSPERRRRMRNVFSSCLPEKSVEIKITGYNAESWGLYEKDMYDCILLDAPCSSERHVINDPKYLSLWTPSRPKRLEITQYAMLSSALMAAKENGYILYSTCSINSGENENNIAKLLSRHSDEVDIVDISVENSEKRKYGSIILPDSSGGLGPMYFCLLQKRSKHGEE